MSFPQRGIPIFPHKGFRPSIALRFKDLFNDNSLHWGWEKHKTDANRKVIESGGLLTVSIVAAAGNFAWNIDQNECPKVMVSPVGYPCETVVKLASATMGVNTQGGLIYAAGGKQFGGDTFYGIVRRRATTPALDGLAVVNSDGVVDWTLPDTTMPVWFKMRTNNIGYHAVRIRFYYSYDGLNYTFAFESAYVEYSRLSPNFCLAVMNNAGDAGNNGASIGFDYFTMKPVSPN